MNQFKNDCSVFEYTHSGKKYYEVKVQKKDKFGNQRKKSSRFTNSGKRISSLTGVNQVKLRLKEEIKALVDQRTLYTWQTWVDNCITKMRKQGLKESTLMDYVGVLSKWVDPSWNHKLLTDISREDAQKYLGSYLINKNATNWTRRSLQKKLHRLFEMAMDEGEITQNPARGIIIHADKDSGIAFSSTEVQILLEKAKAINHPYYPHWVIALLTGMRNGELFALSYRQIDFDAGTIFVNEQYTSKDGLHYPKRGKERTIDLGPELKSFIQDLRASIGPQSQNLWKYEFQTTEVDEMIGKRKTGRKISKDIGTRIPVLKDDLVLPRMRSWTLGAQAKELREFCRKIGIREAKFHDLRATHITNLLSNGVSISKVMRQVGHSRMQTTDAYHRLAGVEIKGITENLGFSVPVPEEDHDGKVIDLFSRKASSK